MAKNKTIKIISLLIILFGFFMSFQSLIASWLSPSANAPSGNVDAPISIGSNQQLKKGSLILNTDGNQNGLVVPYGNVGLGTIFPSAKLDVNGEIRMGYTGLDCVASSSGAIRYNSILNASQYCDGNKWKTLLTDVDRDGIVDWNDWDDNDATKKHVNLQPGNIASGTTIFDVTGTMEKGIAGIEIADPNPDQFDFPNMTNQELGVLVDATSSLIANIDGNLAKISGEGNPEIRCNLNYWSSTTCPIFNNQQIGIRLKTASQNSITRTAIVTIGNKSYNWTVKTKASPVDQAGLSVSQIYGPGGYWSVYGCRTYGHWRPASLSELRSLRSSGENFGGKTFWAQEWQWYAGASFTTAINMGTGAEFFTNVGGDPNAPTDRYWLCLKDEVKYWYWDNNYNVGWKNY